ncbi:MAG: hypothetical protein KME17_16475 [Cyanosarcina radialis HA8281-LM2]|jgi:hypothetical protein|nr:hypothetical protein [Cyanosarcina radialis HA8281-LM2]
MTRDWNATRRRYLEFDLSQQFGHLASSLVRLKSACEQSLPQEMALYEIEESQHYLEWTIPNSSDELKTELIEIQRLLADWQQNWPELWANPNSRLDIAEKAQMRSQHLLDRSGLLVG